MEFTRTRKESAILTQAATSPGLVLGVRDQRRTTPTARININEDTKSIERPHISEELSTKLTSTSADIRLSALQLTDADIT